MAISGFSGMVILRGDGLGGFTEEFHLFKGEYLDSIGVGDLDLDGRLDLDFKTGDIFRITIRID